MKSRIFSISIVLGFLVLSSIFGVFTKASATTPTLTLTTTSTAIPGADFSATPLFGSAPLVVQFTALNSNLLSSCSWTYGDGTSDSFSGAQFTVCPSTTHTYTTTGFYTVKLSVMKVTGATNSMTKTNYIQVGLTATPTLTHLPGCGTRVVVTSTPSPTFTPTPRVATATATSCGPIFITATPLVSNTPGPALPDLSVVSIGEFTYTSPTSTPNPQGCWPSGPLTRIGLRVTIHNTGAGSAGSFAVNLNGSVLMVAGLGAGQTTFVDYLGQTLTRTRVATVDSTGLIAESDETNNTMTLNLSAATSTSTGTLPPQICVTKTITPTPTVVTNGPDLVISSITSGFSGPACANVRKFNVTVVNNGSAAAGTFMVSYSVGGVAAPDQAVNGLAAGQSVVLSFPPATGSGMTATATADSTNVVAETNESNNTTTSPMLPLPSQVPTCTPTGTGPTLTPTITPTFTRTITKTPTCAAPTQERLLVSPVTSPSTSASQVITVTLGHGQAVYVTSEAGSFTAPAPVGNVYTVTVSLVAGANHLQVQGVVSYSAGCPPYSLFTTVDSSGNPLTIVRNTGSVTGTPPTPTRTPTRTPTITPTTSVGTCSPVTSTITAPFTFDGAGTFCWQSSNLGAYINSWNTTSVTINGVNISNVYMPVASYPAKIGGFWYVAYNSAVAWGHLEAK